jgi:hypothetical protein
MPNCPNQPQSRPEYFHLLPEAARTVSSLKTFPAGARRGARRQGESPSLFPSSSASLVRFGVWLGRGCSRCAPCAAVRLACARACAAACGGHGACPAQLSGLGAVRGQGARLGLLAVGPRLARPFLPVPAACGLELGRRASGARPELGWRGRGDPARRPVPSPPSARPWRPRRGARPWRGLPSARPGRPSRGPRLARRGVPARGLSTVRGQGARLRLPDPCPPLPARPWRCPRRQRCSQRGCSR